MKKIIKGMKVWYIDESLTPQEGYVYTVTRLLKPSKRLEKEYNISGYIWHMYVDSSYETVQGRTNKKDSWFVSIPRKEISRLKVERYLLDVKDKETDTFIADRDLILGVDIFETKDECEQIIKELKDEEDIFMCE